MKDERDGRGPDPRAEGDTDSHDRDAQGAGWIARHRGDPSVARFERNGSDTGTDTGSDASADRRIEELFAASRREHADATPGFHETLRTSRPARRWAIRPVFAAATAATCAGVAAVAVAFWTGMVPSPIAPPTEPEGTKQPAAVDLAGNSIALGSNLSGNGADLDANVRARFSTIGPVPRSDSDAVDLESAEMGYGNGSVTGSGSGSGSYGGVVGGVVGGVLGGFAGGVPSGTAVPEEQHSHSRPTTAPAQPPEGLRYQNAVALAPGVVERVRVGKVVDIDAGADNGTQFADTFVEDLPLTGRTYSHAITLPPGVQVSGGVRAAAVHGSRERDFKATVDGASNVDPLTGTFVSNINPHAVNVEDGTGPGANANSYAHIEENEFLAARENPLSTFSIDVDTASYATTRLYLETGRMPPAGAVRIEELINYFPYDDPPPSGDAPLSTRVEIAGCPWNTNHRLARIALKAQDLSRHGRPASNLVFLIDVSGSMDEPAKLPLVVSSLKQLVGELDGRDRVAIVVYAGASGLVLGPTPGSDHRAILAALDRLRAGGGTNGGEGLLLAYRTARAGFIPGGANRVILATDGDFNLGVTDRTDLLGMIGRESGGGIFLTALGFGMGNYKDDFMETLADKGNGNYAYIDSPREARKVLVDGMGGTLVTVAKDVKIQVEFNPGRVAAYRLIGYENRLLAKEDFNDDTKDAGEIGAGHSVTALYEIVPAGSAEVSRTVDPLKYQKAPASTAGPAGPAGPAGAAGAAGAAAPAAADAGLIASDETMTVKLRYKEPEGKQSRLLEVPVVDAGLSVRSASADFKFAASVAMFGMNLRSSKFRGDATLEYAQELASEGARRDPGGYRADFLRLVGVAARLRRGAPTVDSATP